MNYRDVYWQRINHLGTTTAERIRNGGIRSFQKWMAESPHTVRNLSIERGLYFDGIILTNKDKQYEKIMFLNVSNETSLLVGDIMNWTLDNGQVEKWILAQEEKKVNGTYKTFWIIRCNYFLKWVDSYGHLQSSWAYVVSSVDSKIKGNYRTWNNLITPQPNKYAEILMPRYPIERSTNFIVEEESWSLIEYDHTSVPGTIYLSLTENKINSIYDEVEDNLADTDKLAKYNLLIPEEVQQFTINSAIEPIFTITKNGAPINEPYTILTTNKSIVNEHLIAVSEGEVELIIQLERFPEIKQSITIQVISNSEVNFSAYIQGSNTIRLDRESIYNFISSVEYSGDCVFNLFKALVIDSDNQTEYPTTEYQIFNHPKLENKLLVIKKNPITDFDLEKDLATIQNLTGQYAARVITNSKNKLGYMILGCKYDNTQFLFKTIEVIPVW